MQIFFDVHPEPWGSFPFWLIFFNWVETTNYIFFGLLWGPFIAATQMDLVFMCLDAVF